MIIGVTGSRGIVGRHLLKHFSVACPRATIVPFAGDISVREEVDEFFDRLGSCFAIVHLAAVVSIPDTINCPEKAYSTNASGTINLLRRLSQLPCRPYFFYCSTSHVYAPSDRPIKESDRKAPSSVYARTKLIGEMATSDICTSYGIPFCIGRVFSIYDPQQEGTYLYPSIMRRLALSPAEDPMMLEGADSRRDFTSASEVARIIVHLVNTRVEGEINIASGNPVLVRDFVQKLAGRSVAISNVGPTNSIVADISRLERAMGECRGE